MSQAATTAPPTPPTPPAPPERPAIGAVLPYFGGKRAMAAEIARQLMGSRKGLGLVFVPFAGGMSVPLELTTGPLAHRIRGVFCSDLCPMVVLVCRVLAHPCWGPRLVQRLQTMPMARPTFAEQLEIRERLTARLAVDKAASFAEAEHGADEVAAGGIHQLDATLAAAWLYTEWAGNNGFSGTETRPKFEKRYTQGGGDPATRLRAFADGLPPVLSALRRMTLEREDFADTLARAEDAEGVAVYCDPPYLNESRSGGRYRVDFDGHALPMFGEGDEHDRLAGVLNRFERTRVVVSYYAEPDSAAADRLAELYPPPERGGRWRVVRMDRTKGTGKKGISPEVLLVNGEPAAPRGAGEGGDS